MKTGFDQLYILYQVLTGSPVGGTPLDAALTGNIYLLERPVGSQVEDVVINSLPVSGAYIQHGRANVNIYVPNLKNLQHTVPDIGRMRTLTGLAVPLLTQRYRMNEVGEYVFSLNRTEIIAEAQTSQHYVNIVVDFQFFPET